MNIIFIHTLLLIALTYLPNVHEIWKPKVGLTWNWIIGDDPNNMNYKKGEFDVVDLDLYEVKKESIDRYHEDGIKVICYSQLVPMNSI